VLFGDYVDQAPRWSTIEKRCRAFVAAVNSAGGHAELVRPPDAGIHSNSHMMMRERNSLVVADWIRGWTDSHVGG
jgi:hypothetical protein